ncbi:hypothetical protein C8Q74DRAFT_93679 [Fomes fomentarius]|nr:hypothetical protein C8Q74DRAFT_93679 [Fomes fomentarius]
MQHNDIPSKQLLVIHSRRASNNLLGLSYARFGFVELSCAGSSRARRRRTRGHYTPILSATSPKTHSNVLFSVQFFIFGFETSQRSSTRQAQHLIYLSELLRDAGRWRELKWGAEVSLRRDTIHPRSFTMINADARLYIYINKHLLRSDSRAPHDLRRRGLLQTQGNLQEFDFCASSSLVLALCPSCEAHSSILDMLGYRTI